MIKRGIGLAVGFVLGMAGLACAADEGSQSFQIAPPPIAYPYFIEGRMDTKITGTYVSMTMKDVDISIGGMMVDFVGRYAFDDMMAMDGQIGFAGLGSSDFPAIGGASGIVDGKLLRTEPKAGADATFSFFNLPMGFNLELQAVHTPDFSMIMFLGPSLGIAWGSISSPYTIWYYTGQDYTPTHEFGIDMSMVTTGLNLGFQFGIPAGDWNIAPFMMISTMSGSATVTLKSGVKEIPNEIITADVPSTSTTSMGMDLIYEPWGLSIGTMLQQMAANKSDSEMSTMMIQLSWHERTDTKASSSSSGDTPKKAKKKKLVETEEDVETPSK